MNVLCVATNVQSVHLHWMHCIDAYLRSNIQKHTLGYKYLKQGVVQHLELDLLYRRSNVRSLLLCQMNCVSINRRCDIWEHIPDVEILGSAHRLAKLCQRPWLLHVCTTFSITVQT